MKPLGMLFLHGMGDGKPGYAKKMVDRIYARLPQGQTFEHHEVVYSQALDAQQDVLWRRCVAADEALDNGVLRERLRRFALNYLGDAVTYLVNVDRADSPYVETHKHVRSGLAALTAAVGGEGRVVVVAHSLGARVFSDYLWDAQASSGAPETHVRLWKALQRGPTAAELGTQVALLVTLGCNIPLFASGVPDPRNFDMNALAPGFAWTNAYDRDDMLGWPVQPLGETYAAVEDVRVNTAIRPRFIQAHTGYWTDRDVVLDVILPRLREMWA